MTITPSRARGLVDASTGDLVVVTQRRITWARRGAAPVDVTPELDWTCVAIGGGAVAVAGAESVAWTGADGPTRHTSAPWSGMCRLAVAGRRVAGVTREGRLIAWESLGGEPVTRNLADKADHAIEPDDVVMDGRGSLVTVSGWRDEQATLAVLEWLHGDLRPVIPAAGGWPAPATGVVVGVADGVLGIGGTDALTLVSTGGEILGLADLPGLERVTGSADGVGWVRSSAAADGVLVGWGAVIGSGSGFAVDLVAERPMPGSDPFPELAVSSGALIVAEGVDAHRLRLHRLTSQGWLDPQVVGAAVGAAE